MFSSLKVVVIYTFWIVTSKKRSASIVLKVTLKNLVL